VITAAELTRALNGRWHGRYGTARCVVHEDQRPSLSIMEGNDGPIVTCFAGCDWRVIREELRHRGLLDRTPRVRQVGVRHKADAATAKPRFDAGAIHTQAQESARALGIWAEAEQLGDLALGYFSSRGIHELPLPDIDCVLRFHPQCAFGGGQRRPCIIALWTDAVTNEPRAIHRTALKPDGSKLDRKSLGPTRGCIIRLWPDEAVTLGLVIGEGIETTLAAATRIQHRGTLMQPAWAAGDATHLAQFPVLAGIEALTILVDNDEAGQRAARESKRRWLAAGREVTTLTPNALGQDFNDVALKNVLS